MPPLQGERRNPLTLWLLAQPEQIKRSAAISNKPLTTCAAI
jgi:hypothetical protein